MTDHAHYEELAALAAGGLLSEQEHADLRAHLQDCAECRRSVAAFEDLVLSGLPAVRQPSSDTGEATPPAGMRERFVTRARGEGVRLSAEVEAPVRARSFSGVAMAGLAIAATLVMAVLSFSQMRQSQPGTSLGDVDRLTRENAALTERLSAREATMASQEEQLRRLRLDLDGAIKSAGARQGGELPGFRLGQSVSTEARLLEELQRRDQQLADVSDELRRINQMRVTDRTELDAQRTRLRDAFDQLRVATATIDMERQLAQAGKDILQLMLARQLRVVDVRDTDGDGRPGVAFARVFVAEGSSMRIFAFDLGAGASAGTRFQVWGERVGSGAAPRNLGTLNVDDRTQNRWSLSVGDVKDIDSIFVTTAARGANPEGPRLLYALLGRISAN